MPEALSATDSSDSGDSANGDLGWWGGGYKIFLLGEERGMEKGGPWKLSEMGSFNYLP